MNTVTAMLRVLAVLGVAACNTTPPPGTFDYTLSTDTVEFEAAQNATAPPRSSVTLEITGSMPVLVSTSFAANMAPAWLDVAVTGRSDRYTITLSIRSTRLDPGAYTSVLVVAMRDMDGHTLATRAIGISFTVLSHLMIAGEPHLASFTYGSSNTAESISVEVSAREGSWSAGSSTPWLQIGPTTTVTDDLSLLAVTIDSSTLGPGEYTGQLTVTGTTDRAETASKEFHITVRAPVLVLGSGEVILGGADGASALTAELAVSLDTAAASYPFTVESTTQSGGDWLEVTSSDDRVDGSGTSILVTANRAVIAPGTFTGELRIRATVRELVVERTVPVAANVEEHRILVGAPGVGLSSAPGPGRSVLTRAVAVSSSLGRNAVPWQARSDQPWLQVTAGGVVGQPLVLTADPTGLPADTTQFALVTVSSPDPTISRSDTIRVGLRVNSQAATDFSLPIAARHVAASPVEPIVFLNNGGQDLSGYDTNTGAVVRSFPHVVAASGAMAFGPDGRRLYIYDPNNLRVAELDAETGEMIGSYLSRRDHHGIPSGGGLAVMRAAGHTFLITPSARTFDVTTGAEYTDNDFLAPLQAIHIAPALGSSHIVVEADTTYTLYNTRGVYHMRWTALNGGRLVAEHLFATGYEQRGHQGCVSANGETAYTAAGGIRGLDMVSGEVTQMLPMASGYPDAMLCLWNGVIIGGVDAYYESSDIFIYDGPSGFLLEARSSAVARSYRSLLPLGLAASADATRLISLSGTCCHDSSDEVRFQSLPAAPLR